jgi:hypothetical protein
LLVDFLLLLHWDLANAGVSSAGNAVIQEALRVAESAGYEEGIAKALIGMAWVEYRNPATADLARDQADAILTHLGDPAVLRAWLENDICLTLYARGQFADALAHAERSLALKERRTPHDDRDVAISESNICLIMLWGGQAREALPRCERAGRLIVSVLGWNHPTSMNIVENVAAAQALLGRFDEACPLADRVRAFFEGRGEPIDGRITLALTLGRCAAGRGHPGVARDLLERALAEGTRTGATTMELAEIEWQLARAVYAAGDHRRGADIAERAARRYATLPELASRDREIRTWLAAARRDPDR